MKKIITLSLLGTILLLGGCSIMPPSQLGTTKLANLTSEPVGATENSKVTKTGKACGTNILALFAFGDISIEKAKENGKITEVVSVDKEISSVLRVYARVCTIVIGN